MESHLDRWKDKRTNGTDKNYNIPLWHTLYAGGITKNLLNMHRLSIDDATLSVCHKNDQNSPHENFVSLFEVNIHKFKSLKWTTHADSKTKFH